MTKTQIDRAQRRQGIRRIDLAYVELASSEIARDINRDVILELVRTKQPIARADLSRSSGLQPSTVSSIVEQLLEEKWIVEGAAARRPRGRRPTMLSLNGDMVIIVADIRPDQAIIAVVDLNGRFLSREAIPLLTDPERGVGNVIDCMERMRARYPEKSFEGIGLSLPGRVDPISQRLILAPNMKWSNYDIKKAIERRIPLQVEMDNAANACLLSELWFGRMDGIRNAVLITISEGVGAAILLNGQLVTGKSGLAGEFGHVPLNPSGPQCSCGRNGCWEMYASSRAALRFYAELSPKTPASTIQELLNRAENGDRKAIEALSRQAMFLGQGLRLITTALSPELILLTGDLTISWARFGVLVEAELNGKMLAGTPPRLMVTTDAELARLRGAAALVLQRHSGYHRPAHSSVEGQGGRERKGGASIGGKAKRQKR
ncbi:MAG TPA: ROK family protein [Edaphobacter sp.]|nr:ROK family protein [Edaphobacter sp.]